MIPVRENSEVVIIYPDNVYIYIIIIIYKLDVLYCYIYLIESHRLDLSSGRLLHPPCLVNSPMDQRHLPNLVMTFTVRHGRAMAPIEIDGLPIPIKNDGSFHG